MATSTEAQQQPFERANNKVPSNLAQCGVQAEFEFLNYLRSTRFYILLAIVATIGVTIMAVMYVYKPSAQLSSPMAFYSVWWGSIVSLCVILTGIFFGADAISTEFQNKTGYYLLPNPVRRSSIFIGKWIASFLASAIAIGVYAAITIADGAIYFGSNIPYQFGESFVFALFYILPILGVSFFVSSVFKNNSYSILVTAILLLFGFSYITPLITALSNSEPWYVLTYGAGIITNVLSSSGYPPHEVVIGGLSSYNATIPEGLAIMFAYFVVTSSLGLVLFEKKDFN
ncbi:MAG TPA: ABC transporter permease [Nitrososphaerales archaeon]|nr:ABC transporter permease [Nitrososphaerales archaeon]